MKELNNKLIYIFQSHFVFKLLLLKKLQVISSSKFFEGYLVKGKKIMV